MALHWERLGRAGVAIGAGGKADARSLRKQTTACTASAADDLHRGSSTLSARATQRLVPSTRWRRSRRQTASRPKRDGCSEREAKYGQNYMSRSFQPPRAVRHVARSLLSLQSASGRSFCRQRREERRRVASSSAAPGRRLRECALSLVAVVALRYAFAPFGTTVRARPCRVCRERSNAPGRGSQCIRPLLARAARPHPAHCQCCACCALSQEAPP